MNVRIECLILLAAIFVTSLSCGTLGTDDGGGDNLPFRGIGPYTPVSTAEETGEKWFLSSQDDSVVYREPAAMVRDNALELWVVEEAFHDGESQRRIVRFVMDDRLNPEVPEVVFSHEDLPSWAGTWFGAPSVVEAQTGLILAVETGPSEAIVIFREGSDGRFVVDESMQPLKPEESPQEGKGIGSPSLVPVGKTLKVYYTARSDSGRSMIRSAEWNGAEWKREGTLLEPDDSCNEHADGNALCWDASGVKDAEVRQAMNGAGQRVNRLVYSGHKGKNASLGFAASVADGKQVKADINPILGGSKDLLHPSNVLYSDRYLLFYEEKSIGGRHGIGLSEAEGGRPSEWF